MDNHLLVRLIGWRATILHGDVSVVDRWKWLRRHLRPGPLRTLDAGCGSGAFTLYAAKLGNEALGIAFEAPAIAKAQRRARLLGLDGAARFRVADLRRLDEFGAELGTFDQVLLLECIEHIRDDAKLVRDLAARLRPGGAFLLTAPYKHHRPLFGEAVSEVEDGGHVRFGYTHEEVAALLAAAGLEVVAAEFVSGLVSQKLAGMRFALERLDSRLAWAATLPLRVLHPLDAPLTRLTGYPYLSVGVVGRKPA